MTSTIQDTKVPGPNGRTPTLRPWMQQASGSVRNRSDGRPSRSVSRSRVSEPTSRSCPTLMMCSPRRRRWPTRSATDADFRAGLLSATPHLRAFAMSLTGQREAADDLVQDTLLRALQYPDRFEPGTKLQAWLFTILRNIFYSGHRKGRREVEDVDGLYAAKLLTPPEQLGCVEFAALHSALAKLSDEQREAVILVGAEGYSYEQVAEICGTKLGTIKSRVNRARKRLASFLATTRSRPWDRMA